MASRREARLLRGAVAAAVDLEPNNSDSSCLASSRRSFERYVTLTQDSFQRSSPSESSPSHSTSTSSGRPRRPSKRRTAMIRRTAHFPPSSASCPAITGPMATRRRMSRQLCSTSCGGGLPYTLCMPGYPPRHVYAATWRDLLTYLLSASLRPLCTTPRLDLNLHDLPYVGRHVAT
jgi:hypothetical protein